MNHRTTLARYAAAGIGVLALSGAGLAAASTPTTEPPDGSAPTAETAMDMDATASTMAMGTMASGSTPATGAGPSDCPAIPAATAATAPATADTATADTMTMDTMSMDTATADTMTMDTMTMDTMSMDTAAAGDTAPTGSAAATSGPFVQVAESEEFGQILVDGQCRTLYGFTQDVDGEPTCVDDCAAAWPPLFVPGGDVPAVADELDPSLFSVVEHPEGSMLKVGDWPLYYFASDAAPGDVNGQGVGGVWFVVAPDGSLVEGEAGTAGSTPTDTATMDTMTMDTASMDTMTMDTAATATTTG